MSTLVMMRHGQSQWNLLNLFTGWVDIPLSSYGIRESLDAGLLIKDLPIDVIFTSELVRAQMSALLAMSVHSSGKSVRLMPDKRKEAGHPFSVDPGSIFNPDVERDCIPSFAARELNERMYGRLQGLNKQEVMEKYGAAQVKEWRRSYDTPPPEGESLAMTAARAVPYFREHILPLWASGKNVFICAHGNSLRAVTMFLEQLSPAQVVELEIATGVPLFYRYEQGSFIKTTHETERTT